MIAPTFVSSSNLDCIGYKLGVLYVRFNSGQCYSYKGVPFDTFDALRNAESVGGFFCAKIKKGGFNYGLLKDDPFEKKEGAECKLEPNQQSRSCAELSSVS